MYISGVPGTGKTATVTAVINYLKYEASIQKLSKFNYVEINGMKLTEPRQAYIQIYKQLICKKNKDVENNNNYKKSISWENALSILEKTFNSISPNENIVKRKPTPSSHKKLSSSSTYSQKMTILLVDELDCLCNRRQDVIYNLLDWPTKINAKLIVITIANTMDLPERVLMGKYIQNFIYITLNCVYEMIQLNKLKFSLSKNFSFTKRKSIITIRFDKINILAIYI